MKSLKETLKNLKIESAPDADDEGGGDKPDIGKKEIIAWFKKHPNPEDEKDVHAWADKNGWNVHELEEMIYGVLTDFITGKGDLDV
jgi:hypothetical protein